jgi:Uma2 family endonuclease
MAMTLTSENPTSTIMLLENGDRLTRDEFEARYHAMPKHKKVELIEGQVYIASPVRAIKHGKPHATIIGWLFNYCQETPGIELMDNATVRLDADNEPQPDACLRIEEAFGGQSRISDDDYIEGAPELIVEIAASTASYDLYEKKQVYRRNGVKEYLVWRVVDKAFDWFILQNGAYINLPVDEDGIMRSRVFPGLWLPVADLIAGNLTTVVAALNLGLVSNEYQAFQNSLAVNLQKKSD